MRRAFGALAPLISILALSVLVNHGRPRSRDHPRAPRATSPDLAWDGLDTPSAASMTEVAPREKERGPASWRVKVVDHDGSPLPSMRVRVTYAAASFYDPRFREVVTGGDGGAVFDHEQVPIERVTVYGSCGYAGATVTSADLTDNVVTRLERAVPVTGTVVDETGRGVEHALLKCSGVREGYVPVLSSEGGAFTVWSAAKDRVEIEFVGVEGPAGLDRYQYRASPVYAWAGTRDVVMRVSPVQKTDVIRVAVVLPGGLPAAGAMVWVYGIGRDPCATDDTGTAVLRACPASRCECARSRA